MNPSHSQPPRNSNHRPTRIPPPGLEDQLLGKLILKEKHELEEQRQALLEEVQSYKKKIKQLEDDLLFRCRGLRWSGLVWSG